MSTGGCRVRWEHRRRFVGRPKGGRRMRRRSLVGFFAVMVASLLLAPAVWAQTLTAGITGTVRDESQGVLPGVTVEAASPALIEKVRTTVSDGEGRYNFVDLVPGTYTVTFTLTGFKTFVRDGVTHQRRLHGDRQWRHGRRRARREHHGQRRRAGRRHAERAQADDGEPRLARRPARPAPSASTRSSR